MADEFFERPSSKLGEADQPINLVAPEVPEFGSELWFHRSDNTESFKPTDVGLNGSVAKTVSTKCGNGDAVKAMDFLADSIPAPTASAPHDSQGQASEAASNTSDVDVGNVEKAAGAVDENENKLQRTYTAFTGLEPDEKSVAAQEPTVSVSEESESSLSVKDECVRSGESHLGIDDGCEWTYVMDVTIEDAEDAQKSLLPFLLSDNSEATRKNTNFFSGCDGVGVTQHFEDTGKGQNVNIFNKSVLPDFLPAVSKPTTDVRRLGKDITVERLYKKRVKDGGAAVTAVKFNKDVAINGEIIIKAGKIVVFKEIKISHFRKIEAEILKMSKFGHSLPALLAVGFSRNRVMLVLEFVNGELLHDVMVRSRKTPLSERFLYRLSSAAVEAYKMLLENNIVHLDIKPGNVIIRVDNVKNNCVNESTAFDLCVIDYGLVRHFNKEFRDRPGDALCGSPQFMSPLMARNIMVNNVYKNLIEHCLLFYCWVVAFCLTSYLIYVRDNDHAARNFEMIGSITSADIAGSHHSGESRRCLSSTTEKKPQVGPTNGGDNIPVRSSIKKANKQADIRGSVKAATEDGSINHRIRRKHLLNPSRYIDGPSIALSLDAAARGRPFLLQPPKGLNFEFDEAVAWRCKQEKAKFNEYNGNLVESSYLVELARLESDGVSEEERQRFPKWFVRLLRVFYHSNGAEDVAKILEDVDKDAFD